MLITSHDAFRYYANAYGLEVVSAMGTSTEAEPSMKDLAILEKTIIEKEIPAIFIESTISPKLMKERAASAGAVIGGKLFADSLGDKESGADTYLKMIRQNTRLIVEGLLGTGGKAKEEEDFSFLLVILAMFILAFIVVLRLSLIHI